MSKTRNVYAAMRLVLSAQCRLSATERIVMAALLLHVGADGTCWPSVGRLMLMTGLSRRAVQRAIDKVASEPERCSVRLSRERRDRSTIGPRSTLYALEWPAHPATAEGGVETQGEVAAPSGRVSQRPDTASQGRPNDSGSAHSNDNTEGCSQSQAGGGQGGNVRALEDLVLDAYAESFRAARGEDPPSGKEERRAARRILAATRGNVERACKLVRNAYEDPFWARQSTLMSIARDPARFVGEIRSVRRRGDEPRVQRGIDYEPKPDPEALRSMLENVNGDI